MSFLAAFRFLTTIPLMRGREVKPEDLGRSTAYFPLVGLIIGLILAGVNWLFRLVLPPSVVNALLIITLVIITGALHLDGFSDTCDGLSGQKPVEERWRVMRDSHAGAFGVVGLVLLLLVKYAALSSLPSALLTANLIFMPVVSRWAMAYTIFAYKYALPSGLGTAFKQTTRWPQFLAATLISFAIAVVMFPLFSITGLVLIPAVWIVTVLFAIYLSRKFAGLTGDNYGAINEVAEAAALILALVLYHVTGAV